MKITLSEQQQKIVDYDDGSLLVIAGAGSGKTRVLTERILKLTSKLKKGKKILAITFSNKATDELYERLSNSLGEEELNDKVYVGTIHQFCLDIVTSRGSLIGLPNDLQICESYADRLQIFKDALESIPELKSRYLNSNNKENQKKLKDLFDGLSNAKRNLKFSKDYDAKPNIQRLFQEYDDLLLVQGVIDFDDILRYAYRILTERESVLRIYKRIYKHICVDEAQDLNKAQYEIIKSLSQKSIDVTMVGDPKQSIYGFSGADSNYFERVFMVDFNAQKIELLENFRSSKKVISAANKIEKSFEVYGVCKYDGEFKISEFADEFEEAKDVVEKIKFLVSNGHQDVENNAISYEQCIVIARNRYVFKALEERLNMESIEYTLKVSNQGAFTSESDIIAAFELGLRLIVNPKDQLHFIELNNLVSKQTVFLDFDDLRNSNELDDFWACIMSKLNLIWNLLEKSDGDVKFDITIKKLKELIENVNETVDENEKLLAIDDIEEWESHWNSYIKKSQVGERSLSNFFRAVSLGGTVHSNEKGVILSTVHMTKGLEYDVVFIMGLNEGVFPDYRAVNAFEQYNNSKELIEERHNMFVAITRSKRLCYLSYPSKKDTPWGIKYQRASRYVKELLT